MSNLTPSEYDHIAEAQAFSGADAYQVIVELTESMKLGFHDEFEASFEGNLVELMKKIKSSQTEEDIKEKIALILTKELNDCLWAAHTWTKSEKLLKDADISTMEMDTELDDRYKNAAKALSEYRAGNNLKNVARVLQTVSERKKLIARNYHKKMTNEKKTNHSDEARILEMHRNNYLRSALVFQAYSMIIET